MNKKWICFFSQTGSEINTIRHNLNRNPDLIIVNKSDFSDVNEELLNDYWNKIVIIPNKPALDDYEVALSGYKNPIITLHGFLRIIPKELCNKYEIYNLHPGLITKYPELKGFNPQQKAFDMKLPSTGAVIHKVVPEVDSGEILDSFELDIKNLTLKEIYDHLHRESSVLWTRFLRNKL